MGQDFTGYILSSFQEIMMIRLFFALTILALSSAFAQAADNGGFGEKFTNKAPSALMESPDSQIAQSVQSPSADELQNIMPAAGDDIPPEEDKTKEILNTVPTATHEIPEAAPEEKAE